MPILLNDFDNFQKAKSDLLEQIDKEICETTRIILLSFKKIRQESVDYSLFEFGITNDECLAAIQALIERIALDQKVHVFDVLNLIHQQLSYTVQDVIKQQEKELADLEKELGHIIVPNDKNKTVN